MPFDIHGLRILFFFVFFLSGKHTLKAWENSSIHHVTSVLRRGKFQEPAVSKDQPVMYRASKATAQ